MGLNAVYVAFEVDNLEEAMSGIRELGLRGVSVTLPFKTQILTYLDNIGDTAWKIRAVNTIVKEKMVVMDMVYQPLRTKLLREAEERGCVAMDGLEVLARQGAAQFEIWAGKKPEIGQVKEDLRQAMKREESHD